MHYRLIILDRNAWMYLDMVEQTIYMLDEAGHTAELVGYEPGLENTEVDRHVFFGTWYPTHNIPDGSVVTNFDHHTLVFQILTDDVLRSCEIWDYSQRNVDLIKKRVPEARCHLMELGYAPRLDFSHAYVESEKNIDVLMLGMATERRVRVLRALSELGINTLIEYSKVGAARADLIRRTRILISIYGGEDRECISSSRLAPVLATRGFVITENCSDQTQNRKWVQYTVSVDYDQLVSTVLEWIGKPAERKMFADTAHERFQTEVRPFVHSEASTGDLPDHHRILVSDE